MAMDIRNRVSLQHTAELKKKIWNGYKIKQANYYTPFSIDVHPSQLYTDLFSIINDLCIASYYGKFLFLTLNSQ